MGGRLSPLPWGFHRPPQEGPPPAPPGPRGPSRPPLPGALGSCPDVPVGHTARDNGPGLGGPRRSSPLNRPTRTRAPTRRGLGPGAAVPDLASPSVGLGRGQPAGAGPLGARPLPCPPLKPGSFSASEATSSQDSHARRAHIPLPTCLWTSPPLASAVRDPLTPLYTMVTGAQGGRSLGQCRLCCPPTLSFGRVAGPALRGGGGAGAGEGEGALGPSARPQDPGHVTTRPDGNGEAGWASGG